ncbi:MAG: glycoside hydrolase family 18 protein [Candidatus Saccharicenans sp.]|nr:glycoside hydrolase family 18 protein [Candidatus Saccharicenans sp.]
MTKSDRIVIRIKNQFSFLFLPVCLILLLTVFLVRASSQQLGREFVRKEKTAVKSSPISRVIIGYYPGWKKSEFNHTLIDFSSLTHLAHAFAWPDSEGHLAFYSDFIYPELIWAAHRYSVKVLLSLGGWGNCSGFPAMAASPEKRSRFISQLVDFCNTHGYDGVDLDWEFVSSEEESRNFSALVRELSTALKAMDPPRLLTVAAPSGPYWGKWINFEELHPFFDYISFMTYDYHGPWSDHSGHNSPLYTCQNDPCGSFDDSFTYAIIREIPLEKLLLGIAFFGRSFNTGKLYTRFTESRSYNYSDIQKLLASGWKYNWDFCSQVPFLLSPGRDVLISFDDIRSVFRKCRYVLEKGAAGVIIWEITADYHRGRPELLQTVARTFRGQAVK